MVVSSPTWLLKKITAGIQVAKVQSFQLNSVRKGRDARVDLILEMGEAMVAGGLSGGGFFYVVAVAIEVQNEVLDALEIASKRRRGESFSLVENVGTHSLA